MFACTHMSRAYIFREVAKETNDIGNDAGRCSPIAHIVPPETLRQLPFLMNRPQLGNEEPAKSPQRKDTRAKKQPYSR
jgi:hypothetical protein